MKCAFTLALAALMATLSGCYAMKFVPAGAGASGVCPPYVEVVRFPTTEGLTLEGRMYPPLCERPASEKDTHQYPRLPESYKKAVVLHCHGVADNDCSAMACFFTESGFRVFQFDYRGFGHSDKADPTNTGFADDAVAALHYLRTRPDVDPDRVLIYGHSMGGAYALAAGAAARAEGKPVRAVVTADAFSSWRLVANHHLPIIGFIFGGVNGPDPVDYARGLGDTPLLILHVQDDEAVPVENAFRLYRNAVAAGVPASLHLHPDGGHTFPMLAEIAENGLEKAAIDFGTMQLSEHPPMTPRQRAKRWSINFGGADIERSETLGRALQGIVLPAPPEPAKGAAPTPQK